MMRRRDVSRIVVVMVVTILSAGIEANKHRDVNEDAQGTAHHQPNHHHHHHHLHNKHHHHSDSSSDNTDGIVTSLDDNELLSSDRIEYEDDDDDLYDDYSSRRELFQLTDKDGDGFVTREEYVLHNGNHSAVVDQVFTAYDGDRDGRFSEEEFLQGSSPLTVTDECEEQIIQTCDKMYLEYRNTEPRFNKVDETACQAFQYLVDCVSGYDTSCDITSYAEVVASRAKDHLDSCPLLDIHKLLKLTGEGALVDESKARFARSTDDEVTTLSYQQLHTKTCSASFINRCSVKFHTSVTKRHNRDRYCSRLATFAHCLNKRANYCSGTGNNALLQRNMTNLKKLQRAAKSCHSGSRSSASQ